MAPALPPGVGLVVRRLKEEYGAERVILFGSYAEGRAAPDSDDDLLVIKETTDRHYDRIRQARRAVRDPHRKFPLDIIVLTPRELEHALATGDAFLQQVVQRGVVLHAS